MSTMTLAERRETLVNSLRASKSWTTGYAEAFVDDYVQAAHLARPAQAVDVVAIREVVDSCSGEAESHENEGMPSTAALFSRLAVKLTRALTSEKAGRAVEDPTGFSAEMVLDEANNWTRRHTGKQMLLNYATLLASPTPDKEG